MSMEENKGFWKNVVDFLERNGFYVALGICIVIIAVAVISVRNDNPLDDDNLSIDNSDSQDEDVSYGELVDDFYIWNGGLPDIDPNEPVHGANFQNDDEAVPVNAGPDASGVSSSIEFIMPVSGGVTFDYSMDELTYSRTLEEWRVHSGLDLEAEIGTAVQVVADGVITDIKNDPGYGVTVIVEHDNDIKTVYANLADASMAQVNMKVNAGDVIGAVGDTALFECAEEAHLHFEVLENGSTVDPKTLLPME